MTAVATPRRKVLLFGCIGIGNTIFDVALYTALRSAGHSAVTANVVSTSAALVVSYLLNAKLTFKRRWSASSFLGFLAVTLFGLEVLQTAAIIAISRAADQLPADELAWLGTWRHPAVLAIPKLLATGVSFAWNFSWYNKVLFRHRPAAEQAWAALE
jgi:putative flippase GtrA